MTGLYISRRSLGEEDAEPIAVITLTSHTGAISAGPGLT